MKKYTKDELCAVIAEHKKWLDGNRGSRADLRDANLSGSNLSGSDLRCSDLRGSNLSGADLSGADLSGANLRCSDLRGSNLSGADLSGAGGVKFAQCSFAAHGECGRQLLAVAIGDDVVFYCGCFRGSADELEKYIADGQEKYRASRTFAFEFVKNAINIEKQ